MLQQQPASRAQAAWGTGDQLTNIVQAIFTGTQGTARLEAEVALL